MAFVAYVNATQHIAAGGKTYDVYDKNAYRMNSNLDPGASTANTVGTSADPFAAVYGAALYATTYYLGGVAETLTPTQSVATTYTISTTIGAGDDNALATTSAVKAFASTTGNLTTTLASASTPYYFTGVSAATAGDKSGIYVATGAYMKDGLLYSGGTQVLTSYTNTTYTFASGTNGFTVTPSGGSAQTVTVTPSIADNVTGSGTSGYLAKFNGTNTIANGPQLGSTTTTFLSNANTWLTPAGTYSLPLAASGTRGGIQIGYAETSTPGSVYNAAVQLSSEKAYVAITQAAILAALSPTTLPITSASSTYTIATSLGTGSATAIPTTSAVVAALTPTKAAISFTAASGVTPSLTGYAYSDGWVHIYGTLSITSTVSGGGALFYLSSSLSAYAPIEGTSFVAYAPFGTGTSNPSSRVALGYAFTGSPMFFNKSTTTIASGMTVYIDIYYKRN